MFFRRRFFIGFAALALLASAWAIAVGPGPQAATIPYRGHLDLDGAPLNSTVMVTFELFDDANPANSSITWSETHNVLPVGGDFSVILGSTSPVPDAAFTAATLFLQISVDGTPLNGLQPILPVPTAQRADLADTLNVTTLNATNAGVTGTLSTNVISATSIGAVSASVDDATITTGNLTNLNVNAYFNSDNVETSYAVDHRRWTIEANHNPAFPANGTATQFIPLDSNRMNAFCGDIDGCTVRIAMRGWNTSVLAQTHASTGPHHFHINPVNGAWRIPNLDEAHSTDASVDYAPITAVDGDGAVNHILRAWDCYFTDGVYTPGSGATNDAARGLGFLAYNSASYNTDCILIIDD